MNPLITDDPEPLFACRWPKQRPTAPLNTISVNFRLEPLDLDPAKCRGQLEVSVAEKYLEGVCMVDEPFYFHAIPSFGNFPLTISGNSRNRQSCNSPARLAFAYWRIGIEKEIPGALFVRGWCDVPCLP